MKNVGKCWHVDISHKSQQKIQQEVFQKFANNMKIP